SSWATVGGYAAHHVSAATAGAGCARSTGAAAGQRPGRSRRGRVPAGGAAGQPARPGRPRRAGLAATAAGALGRAALGMVTELLYTPSHLGAGLAPKQRSREGT